MISLVEISLSDTCRTKNKHWTRVHRQNSDEETILLSESTKYVHSVETIWLLLEGITPYS